MSSLADEARSNLLAELVETESPNSNVDLFAAVLAVPGQTFITETNASVANQYWTYLLSVRSA